jgi:hypothetical protein
MSYTNLSGRFASVFDSKKFFITTLILVIALVVDTEIGNVSDIVHKEISSNVGIATFIAIWLIFAVSQYCILAYVKKINKESRIKVRHLNLMHNVITIAQFVLVGVIGLVILQMFIAHEYNTAMIYAAMFVSFGLAIISLGLLARAFISWYRSNKSLMVLIFAVSMVAYVINVVFLTSWYTDLLSQNKSIIRSSDIAVFPKFSQATVGDILSVTNQVASGIAYVFTWIGTVTLLRQYVKKLGRIKFWTIMGVAMIYYLITFPLFTLGYFNPSENVNAMTNIIISYSAGIFVGIIFGAAFLSVARTLPAGSFVREYMRIAAYGFILLYIVGSASVSQAAYPPYSITSISFFGLSCYLIYSGLYFSAISVSQDMALRKTIRKSITEQSKLLDQIGSGQLERELQGRVMAVATKASNIMAEETGVEAPMTEREMKDYMELVIKETKKEGNGKL